MVSRSCIGCKTVCEKDELLRLVLIEGRVSVDLEAKLPGRGAYIHTRMACVRKGMDIKMLAHRFRCKGKAIDVSALKDLLADLVQGNN